MAIEQNSDVMRQIHTLFTIGTVGELTDGQLLERFATRKGEAGELAFAALVERHGPMVLRVCRASSCDEHAAQDAFQATFLVLARKARRLWVRDSLGPWLHQVAWRTAACARAAEDHRRRIERRAAAERARRLASAGVEGVHDLERVLHEELVRLPERYRIAVVLCDLEGRTHEQAARQLGWPAGTVKSRQARGRAQLRDRLTRRGLAPAIALGAMLSAQSTQAAVPATLVRSTIATAMTFAAGRAAAGLVPAAVAKLAEGVLKTMVLAKIRAIAIPLLAISVAIGAGIIARGERPTSAAQTEPAKTSHDEPLAAEPSLAKPPRTDDVPLFEAKAGKLSAAVVERGSLEASRSADVYSEVEGVTDIISLVPEGTHVKKREAVCELDSSALRDNLTNQRITIKGAESSYLNASLTRQVAEIAVAEYVKGISEQELYALKAEITAAQSAIQRAENRLERTQRARKRLNEKLAAKGDTTTPADILAELDIDDRLEATEGALEREKMTLELAKTKQAVLENYTRIKTTKELEADVERNKKVELAKQSSWELEKQKEVKLRKQIESCKILAPSDGTIVLANDPYRMTRGQVQIEEGAQVRERQKILSVVDLNSPMRVNVKVHESMVDRVTRDLPARIRVDAFPNEVLTGTVEIISPLPDPSSTFRSDVKVFTTLLKLEKGPRGLRPGMTAQVEILLNELDNVLSVPVQAVLMYGGKAHVAVKKPEGGFEWRDVSLGQSNDKYVEVKQGLKSGERVALNPFALMSEEDKREKGIGTPTKPTAEKPGPRRPQERQ